MGQGVLGGQRQWKREQREGKGKSEVRIISPRIQCCSADRGYRATTPLSDEDAFNDPLPKVAYDTQSLKRIKQLLRDQGLSDTGDKPALVARHEQCVLRPLLPPCPPSLMSSRLTYDWLPRDTAG